LAGPVLVVPYVETRKEAGVDSFGKPVELVRREAKHWLYFPKSLALDGQVLPSVRSRGLHEVRVYELRSTLAARFDARLPEDPDGVRAIGRPYLSLSIADVRGLVGTPTLSMDGAPLPLVQGNGGHRDGRGLHALLPTAAAGSRLA